MLNINPNPLGPAIAWLLSWAMGDDLDERDVGRDFVDDIYDEHELKGCGDA